MPRLASTALARLTTLALVAAFAATSSVAFARHHHGTGEGAEPDDSADEPLRKAAFHGRT